MDVAELQGLRCSGQDFDDGIQDFARRAQWNRVFVPVFSENLVASKVFSDVRIRARITCSFGTAVILSAAKNLAVIAGEILRCAQDDDKENGQVVSARILTLGLVSLPSPLPDGERNRRNTVTERRGAEHHWRTGDRGATEQWNQLLVGTARYFSDLIGDDVPILAPREIVEASVGIDRRADEDALLIGKSISRAIRSQIRDAADMSNGKLLAQFDKLLDGVVTNAVTASSKWLKTEQVAARLGLHRATVERKFRSRELDGDKTDAIRWAEALSLGLTKAEFGIKDAEDTKTAISIRRALVMWLRYQETQNSRTTYRSYRSISRKLCRFLTRAGVSELCDLSRETMMGYRAWCLKLKNSKVTVDNNLIALRSFLSWSVSKGWITMNPLSQSRYGERIFFDEKSERKDPYTRDEFSSITTMADGDDRSVFTLLGRWGLRISELAMLEWVDVDDVGRWLHIRNKRTHDGIDYKPKDKTDRKMPLEGRAVTEILRLFGERGGRSGYVLPLPQVKHREDYAERHFLKKLKELAEPTGIDPTRLTLHRFRHFFVCECADRGIPMATVMAWVGHDEMKMVMYYTGRVVKLRFP